jgi:apolipoprotein D and lipocalin family protein
MSMGGKSNRIFRGALVALMSCAAGCAIPPVNSNPRTDAPLESLPVDLPRYIGR